MAETAFEPPVERFFSSHWEDRLKFIVELMRDLSSEQNPQRVVELYAARMKSIIEYDLSLSLSRRDLLEPYVRVTRNSKWKEAINPWENKARLPLISSGILSELIYGEEPVIIDELKIAADDPAAEYFAGMRSLFAIPMYDQGKALNMVITASKHPNYYPRERSPEFTWMSNLFGRATHTLVLTEELQRAYDVVDRELKVVADIQRSLLPTTLPEIPGLDLAAHYATSQRAGGDYYDFFPLSDGRWGILIADVSGHGTPAAVLMAVTHSIAHSYPGHPTRPGEMLGFINKHLAARYTNGNGTFVTAFYGMYDPKTRAIEYACAGHGPPRIKSGKDGTLRSLDQARNLPLGIDEDEVYQNQCATLQRGDVVIFYTDGITETRNAAGDLFGVDRLDQVLAQCTCRADDLIEKTLAAVNEFGGYLPATDDRTLLAARVT
jgi:sigma-B regulation protein RsbU (phosphoserine phosphatase)